VNALFGHSQGAPHCSCPVPDARPPRRGGARDRLSEGRGEHRGTRRVIERREAYDGEGDQQKQGAPWGCPPCQCRHCMSSFAGLSACDLKRKRGRARREIAGAMRSLAPTCRQDGHPGRGAKCKPVALAGSGGAWRRAPRSFRPSCSRRGRRLRRGWYRTSCLSRRSSPCLCVAGRMTARRYRRISVLGNRVTFVTVPGEWMAKRTTFTAPPRAAVVLSGHEWILNTNDLD
jgi:hypothetical protein